MHCSGTKTPGDWVGWRSLGEEFGAVTPLSPRLRTCLGLRGTPQVLPRAPWRWASAAAPDGAHPAVLSWGQHLRLRAARGVKISVQGAGLAVGRRTGRSPGREAAAPEPQSRRPEEAQGHLRTPSASSRSLAPQGWDLEAWEGLAPSPGPPEAGAWLRD